METRIALLGIIVEETSSTEELNKLLHDYNTFIVGRLGVPYRQRGVCIISVILDAPESTISTLSGKIGMLPGISIKTMYSKK